MTVPDAPTALIIDDSPELRAVMTAFLTHLGLRVLAARDGETGFALAQEHRPDLVCLDLMLPTVSGLEVCERLKRSPRTSDVPVLMVSARTFPQDRAEARRAGADAYLTKPLNRQAFSGHVRTLVWQRRLAVGA
ncbi:MAG: response regulator [Vicinamibacterales bacterium]|nr:response regulator [Vicinamibacterales bacterium]